MDHGAHLIPHLTHVICIPRICIIYAFHVDHPNGFKIKGELLCVSFYLALVSQKSPVMDNPHLCLIETDDALSSPAYWGVFTDNENRTDLQDQL